MKLTTKEIKEGIKEEMKEIEKDYKEILDATIDIDCLDSEEAFNRGYYRGISSVLNDIKRIKEPETEYLVMGSDNFWYESGSKELKEAIAEVKDIKKDDNISSYANPESGMVQEDLPDTFYIYKAELVKEI